MRLILDVLRYHNEEFHWATLLFVSIYKWLIIAQDMIVSMPPLLLEIITLFLHKKARFDSKMHGSTQKARFDTKMPGSTQKCPPQHASLDIAIIKHPPPPPPPPMWEIFFSDFIPIFCF